MAGPAAASVRLRAKSSSLVMMTASPDTAWSPQDSISGLEPQVQDVLRDVSSLGEPAGQGWWKLGIHQEAHQATRSTGWSASRAANSRAAAMSAGSR
jgi:hypothetical protein